jgi:hypothetical protein
MSAPEDALSIAERVDIKEIVERQVPFAILK